MLCQLQRFFQEARQHLSTFSPFHFLPFPIFSPFHLSHFFTFSPFHFFLFPIFSPFYPFTFSPFPPFTLSPFPLKPLPLYVN
ncbi:hypothetical protein HMPREF1991_02981 [Hoylesella loescheii DSM 19665 = JCM 12249 = ATCC 15930]|uniref:Uncharacterized protein n=1 Tax=Hoylesella loescheii DSM 19665 = JCM 12249 = ATCC 15930 TaxID=1122985 RepID=A0A069QE52_HOYLO|nr:hypothetical protein HMPREF1991_02981 [Hoylesella loescheii DSM 19665 = JCM 12249 = ATCC 15930]